MAVVGSATLNVTPKFPGLAQAIQSELNKAAGSSSVKAGEKFGTGFGQGASGGLAKSGAIIGAFSAITSSAMQSISSHVGDAISRFDTLNNYPIVMQNLGYSSESADASIAKMSDHLLGLPTALDSVVSTVQGIVAVTDDLDQATDVGLALNDMLLASGSNQQLVNSAMEQFRQMLSKGKPELQDWKSLTSAMPGQMKQLAQALLGPTANANDLYTALGGGGAEATITMDQLLAKIVELDQTGGDGFASFEEQARTATGGVATSAANMGTAITRGIADVMDAIGKENISGTFTDITSGINTAADTVSGIVSSVMPGVKSIYDLVKGFAPEILTAAASFTVLNKAAPVVQGLATKAGALREALQLTAGGAGSLTESLGAVGLKLNPLSIGIGVASVAIGFLGTKIADYVKKEEMAEKATTSLSDAVSDVTSLDEYGGVISNIAGESQNTAMSLDELNESFVNHADKMAQVTSEAQSQIGELNTAQSIIRQYAGQTDLTSEAQGRLSWAIQEVNDQFGLSITASDVAANKYTDQNGKVQNLTESIDNLINKKKQEIQMSALQDNYSEALKAQQEAADAYADALANADQKTKDLAYTYTTQGMSSSEAWAAATQDVTNNLNDLKNKSDTATQAVEDIEEEMGDTAKSTSDAADAFDDWANRADDATQKVFSSILRTKGLGLNDIKDDLRTLKADTEDLSSLSSDQLQELATAYDGTTSSIIGKLDEWGVGMDQAAADVARNTQSIKDSLNNMGDELKTAFENSGVDIDAFSQKLSDAGISTDQLNQIGSDNLASLAQSCQGNMDAMIFFIQNYNSTPIVDKNGLITLDDVQLIDAQGNLYTWNGSTLVDKNGNAVVDDISLIDAYGNVVTWNGTGLSPKNTNAQVNGNMGSAINQRDEWNRTGLEDWRGSGIIDIVTNFFQGNASGGIRLNAAGGYRPRYHADGMIAKRAVPLDIVGEDGAEAIVPLTNRRYSQPFIDLLADGIQKKSQPQVVYSIGNVTLDVSSLKDLDTIEEFVDMVLRAKRVR